MDEKLEDQYNTVSNIKANKTIAVPGIIEVPIELSKTLGISRLKDPLANMQESSENIELRLSPVQEMQQSSNVDIAIAKPNFQYPTDNVANAEQEGVSQHSNILRGQRGTRGRHFYKNVANVLKVPETIELLSKSAAEVQKSSVTVNSLNKPNYQFPKVNDTEDTAALGFAPVPTSMRKQRYLRRRSCYPYMKPITYQNQSNIELDSLLPDEINENSEENIAKIEIIKFPIINSANIVLDFHQLSNELQENNVTLRTQKKPVDKPEIADNIESLTNSAQEIQEQSKQNAVANEAHLQLPLNIVSLDAVTKDFDQGSSELLENHGTRPQVELENIGSSTELFQEIKKNSNTAVDVEYKDFVASSSELLGKQDALEQANSENTESHAELLQEIQKNVTENVAANILNENFPIGNVEGVFASSSELHRQRRIRRPWNEPTNEQENKINIKLNSQLQKETREYSHGNGNTVAHAAKDPVDIIGVHRESCRSRWVLGSLCCYNSNRHTGLTHHIRSKSVDSYVTPMHLCPQIALQQQRRMDDIRRPRVIMFNNVDNELRMQSTLTLSFMILIPLLVYNILALFSCWR